MKTIATLITCHNRKDKTLSCIDHLFAATIPEGVTIDVFLVDDGSTDGTGEIIKEKYPQINIIQGSGALYWAGGMRLAWNKAKEFSYDYYLWLNDDTNIFKNALQMLLSSAQETENTAIICSSIVSQLNGKLTYGGKKKYEKSTMLPNGHLIECDIVCGNCVLVPRDIFDRVGNFDPVFTHAIGDHDYGLRAKRAGFKCFITPSFAGTCECNTKVPEWCRDDIPFFKRISNLYSPLAYAQPWPYFVYNKRHFGIFRAIYYFLLLHIRVVFPQLWKSK